MGDFLLLFNALNVLLFDALLLGTLLTGLILSQGLETFNYADFALRYLTNLLTNDWALNFLD